MVICTRQCWSFQVFGEKIEADESYFGARRVRGKRARGAYGKAISLAALTTRQGA